MDFFFAEHRYPSEIRKSDSTYPPKNLYQNQSFAATCANCFMLSGTPGLLISEILSQFFWMSPTSKPFFKSKNMPSPRIHCNSAKKPQPPSKTLPVGTLSASLHKKPIKGATYSGEAASTISLGMTVAVIAVPAPGRTAFTLTFFLAPSFARAKVNPTTPLLAAE